jgi:protease-4
LIYDALDNKDLKALVVRVDSPGGSVMASEKIRLAIDAAKAKKIPVIVSMANLAASGGYWISLPADVIFADPSTITGSITTTELVDS